MTCIDHYEGLHSPTVEAARREAFELRGEVRQLKKELTKARELLHRAKSVVPMQHWTLSGDIEDFIDHQPTPEAKGETREKAVERLFGHFGDGQ